MLFAIGAVQFDVAPVNMHEYGRETGADFATKDIVGAARPREFVGESDDLLSIVGRLFPRHFGGMGSFEALRAMSRSGAPQMVVRGDGAVYGWYLITRVKEKATYLDRVGVPREIAFEIEMKKSPRGASPASMLAMLMALFP